MAAPLGKCQTWLEIPKTGFVLMQLIERSDINTISESSNWFSKLRTSIYLSVKKDLLISKL